MAVTVAEILNLPIMKDAVVVAGKRGLGGDIRWVHISELLDISRLLNGGEFLLTTGMGLSVPPEQQAEYMRRLAERRVAAVGIAMAAFGREIPAALTLAAEEVGLPLIAFTREIKFVQITEEVHTLIVNRHYLQFRQAETIATQLNRAALEKKDATEILRILYQVLKNPVACVSHDESARPSAEGGLPLYRDLDAEACEGTLHACYPPGEWGETFLAELSRRDLRDLASQAAAGGEGNETDAAAPVTVPMRLGQRMLDVWLQPIVVTGQLWGYLAVVQTGIRLNEVERLVVDRASVTLAYEILRRRSLWEQRRGILAQLAESILSGRIADKHLLYQRARTLGHDLEGRWFAAVVAEVPPGVAPSEADQHISAVCGSLSLGFLNTWKGGRLHLLTYGGSESGLRSNLASLARKLEAPQSRTAAGRVLDGPFRLGIGRIQLDLEEVERSRRQAEFTLSLRAQGYPRGVSAFFDSTGVHRLFGSGMEPAELQRFVQEELGPLLHLEESERAVMLQSLRVLLDNNMAMVTASKLMALSRQTMYQRRERLEELLGCSLEDPERRLSLGLALRAFEIETLENRAKSYAHMD